MMRKLIVLDGYTLNPGDLSWEVFNDFCDIMVYDRTPDNLVVERAEGADFILTNKVVIDAEMIKQLPKLKYIGVLATGFNVVDIDAAKKQEIVVTNIPAYSTNSVAQMVFAHIFAHFNKVEKHGQHVAEGGWVNSVDFSYFLSPQTELAGKTMGIVGYGRIGSKIAQIALAFGMKVLIANRSVKTNLPHGITQVSVEEVFEQSDIVSINCPLSDDNKGFVNRELISKMKQTALLVNTGRGPLINEPDLAGALNNGTIAGASLDVLSTEPPAADNPLLEAKNCIITPHIAWATFEARSRLMDIAAENLKAFIKGEPVNVVG
jgi:glycerate dehydrogenase